MWNKILRQRKLQTVLIFLIIMICTMLLAGASSILTSLEKPSHEFAKTCHAMSVKIYPYTYDKGGFEFTYPLSHSNLIVTIDPKRITEVIYNLIENSMKYMDNKKGRIIIEAEYVEKHILIKVIDNGPGISADDIPYVFDKFYRAEKSRSSSIPGSGLGLSICKYIINEHGGEIYCKSSNRNGCEIGFTIV